MGFFDDLFIGDIVVDEDYINYRNGPTGHGTFTGTCKLCGIVWEFENYEVIPVPYPHGT